VAMAVRCLKQVERFAATLYSPPATWSRYSLASAKGTMPGSSRVTKAPKARKSCTAPAAAGIDSIAMLPLGLLYHVFCENGNMGRGSGEWGAGVGDQGSGIGDRGLKLALFVRFCGYFGNSLLYIMELCEMYT